MSLLYICIFISKKETNLMKRDQLFSKIILTMGLSFAVIFMFIAVMSTSSCSSDDNEVNSSSSAIAEPGESGTFVDERDEKTYKYITIGSQVWMAENLNYSNNYTVGFCYGSDPTGNGDLRDNENCNLYGRLYPFYDAIDICPDGWHLPSNGEWGMLINAIGGEDVAAIKLKTTSGWNSDGNGTDYYNFSALPGGYRNPENGRFYDAGYYGTWWTASGDNYGSRIYMSYDNEINSVLVFGMVGSSVRCIQD
jgi:uncharacterized protein (TIGR02145 family)